MDTFKFLVESLTKMNLDNDWDRFIYPNFQGTFEEDKKRFLGIPDNERVAYIREISADSSCPEYLAISDKGIYYRGSYYMFFKKVNDTHIEIKFENISNVSYSQDKDAFIFSDGSYLNRKVVVKKLNCNDCIKFAEILTEAANTVDGALDYFNRANKLFSEEKYEEAINIYNLALESLEADDYLAIGAVNNKLGLSHLYLEEREEALSCFNIAEENLYMVDETDREEILPYILFNQSHLQDDGLAAYVKLIKAYTMMNDSEDKKNILENLNSLIKSDFFENSFNDSANVAARDIILYTGDDFLPISSDSYISVNNDVLKVNKLSFPIGHPQKGTFYKAHPIKPGTYVPLSNYEEDIFIERVNEFCYLLQALGATQIEINKVYGKSVENVIQDITAGSLSMNYKLFGVDLDSNNKKLSTQENKSSFSFGTSQKYRPTKAPYVPDDIEWIKIDSKWNRLIDSRLNNSLEEYTEVISTSDYSTFSKEEETQFNADIKIIFAKLKGRLSLQNINRTKKDENTQWRITVKFATDLDNIKSDTLSNNELEYSEEVKFLESNGGISNRERRLLNRLRESLGISEKRAAELEALCNPNVLSQEEQEYAEEVKAVLEDGAISERERRLLDRLAKSLNISSERVKQIEDSLK